jgi:hypothetical protein
MAVPCFRKKDSSPPVCGVHKALLVPVRVAIDHNAPHLGEVPCFVCPVTRQVLPDPPKR